MCWWKKNNEIIFVFLDIKKQNKKTITQNIRETFISKYFLNWREVFWKKAGKIIQSIPWNYGLNLKINVVYVLLSQFWKSSQANVCFYLLYLVYCFSS